LNNECATLNELSSIILYRNIFYSGRRGDDDGRRKNPASPARARTFYCATAYTHLPTRVHTHSHTRVIPMHLFGYDNKMYYACAAARGVRFGVYARLPYNNIIIIIIIIISIQPWYDSAVQLILLYLDIDARTVAVNKPR